MVAALLAFSWPLYVIRPIDWMEGTGDILEGLHYWSSARVRLLASS